MKKSRNIIAVLAKFVCCSCFYTPIVRVYYSSAARLQVKNIYDKIMIKIQSGY